MARAAVASFASTSIAPDRRESTWPIASGPRHLSLAGPNNNDFHFNTFVVMWGARALAADPLEGNAWQDAARVYLRTFGIDTQ